MILYVVGLVPVIITTSPSRLSGNGSLGPVDIFTISIPREKKKVDLKKEKREEKRSCWYAPISVLSRWQGGAQRSMVCCVGLFIVF